jgi:hypothetical protein
MLMTFRYSGYQFAYLFKQFNDADIGVTVGISRTRKAFYKKSHLSKTPQKTQSKRYGQGSEDGFVTAGPTAMSCSL